MRLISQTNLGVRGKTLFSGCGSNLNEPRIERIGSISRAIIAVGLVTSKLPRPVNQPLSTEERSPLRWRLRLTGVPAILLLAGLVAPAQSPDQVLVVTNSKSVISREIGQYYVHRRGIPLLNICTIATAPQETIARSVYNAEIETPIGAFLKSHGLQEKILYIVLTSGVPLRVDGPGDALRSERASVDSELTLLYRRIHGVTIPLPGPVNNPFYRHQDAPFRHPAFPMYLVTRLDGYSMSDMKGMVDRALLARNTGKFVIDLKTRENNPGNQWLRTAALLAAERSCRAG